MKLIPAITIMDGRVVVVEGTRYAYLKNEAGQYRSPVKLLRELKAPGEEAFVLDIGGLERNAPDLDTVKRMAAHRDIWLDAGTDDAESMMDLLVSDVSMVVMGTNSMRDLEELGRALDISDNVVFSVGYDRGTVSPDPDIAGIAPEQLMAKLDEMPNLRAGLFFDMGGIRDRVPPDIAAVSEMLPFFDELYVSGHLAPEDLDSLERAGVKGAFMDFRKLEEIKDEGT